MMIFQGIHQFCVVNITVVDGKAGTGVEGGNTARRDYTELGEIMVSTSNHRGVVCYSSCIAK